LQNVDSHFTTPTGTKAQAEDATKEQTIEAVGDFNGDGKDAVAISAPDGTAITIW
jgi:FG-GAP repeat